MMRLRMLLDQLLPRTRVKMVSEDKEVEEEARVDSNVDITTLMLNRIKTSRLRMIESTGRVTIASKDVMKMEARTEVGEGDREEEVVEMTAHLDNRMRKMIAVAISRDVMEESSVTKNATVEMMAAIKEPLAKITAKALKCR